MLGRIAAHILELDRPHPVRVAVDGCSAAARTTLADHLVPLLRDAIRDELLAPLGPGGNRRYRAAARGDGREPPEYAPRRYRRRYIPGERLCLAEVRPRDRAQVVLDKHRPGPAAAGPQWMVNGRPGTGGNAFAGVAAPIRAP